jgi:hypothetical protein
MITRREAAGVGARLIRLAATVVIALLVLGIAFEVLGGNPRNDIVSSATDAARALAGPFDGMFRPHSHELAIAINWGVAAAVYVVLAGAVGRLVLRAGGVAKE